MQGQNQVGKFIDRWEVTIEVGNLIKLGSIYCSWKISNFSQSFELHRNFTNTMVNFPNSNIAFQLKRNLTNFELFNIELSNFSIFPTLLRSSMIHGPWTICYWKVSISRIKPISWSYELHFHFCMHFHIWARNSVLMNP